MKFGDLGFGEMGLNQGYGHSLFRVCGVFREMVVFP